MQKKLRLGVERQESNKMTNNNPIGNIANIIQQYNQFKASFNGNAQEEVQKLLSNGRMTQQQFNQLQAAASQLRNVLK